MMTYFFFIIWVLDDILIFLMFKKFGDPLLLLIQISDDFFQPFLLSSQIFQDHASSIFSLWLPALSQLININRNEVFIILPL